MLSPLEIAADAGVEAVTAEALYPTFLAVRQTKAPDPDYERLYAETNRGRMPIKLGDFGVEQVKLAGQMVSLRLKHHSVAIVKLQGQR